ncbi:PP2C family serine/threonine-protein phosphatase, partial [Moorena sp. SIO3H5]|uniref:PP2C family serine/threonine-protein phosphatase n=1 Tax=Moorena sp. SIO3H5 TaxID=2607834 RepID=UPI0013BE039C
MPWKIVSCSVTGISHKKRGIPCQDYAYYDYLFEQDVVIGAVADGAGSARYSDKGSKIAVEQAIAYIRENSQFLPNNKKHTEELFSRVLDRVINSLGKKASLLQCSLDDLACTLIVFVTTPSCLAAMQIGDGLIVVQTQDKSDYDLLFMPNKGEYANETTFVTSTSARSEMKTEFKSIQVNFIAEETDLDRCARALTSLLRTALDRYTLQTEVSSRKPIPWWNSELESLRKT